MAEIVNQPHPTQPADKFLTVQEHNKDIARIEERIDHNLRLEEVERDHLKELLETLRREADKAMLLKAEENEIHFTKLNGEYTRIDKITNNFVIKELHEKDIKELRELIFSSKEIVLSQLAQAKEYVDDKASTNAKAIKELQDVNIAETGRDTGRAAVLSPTLKWVLGIASAIVISLILLAISNYMK